MLQNHCGAREKCHDILFFPPRKIAAWVAKSHPRKGKSSLECVVKQWNSLLQIAKYAEGVGVT